MQGNSFIHIWRSIMETSFYKKPLTCHLAIHLILSAAWKDHETIIGGEIVKICRGQIATGRERLARETGLSPQQIRTALQHLKKCEFLTSKPTNKYSLITICNYEQYQCSLNNVQPADQPATNQQPTSNQPQQNKGNNTNNNIYAQNEDRDSNQQTNQQDNKNTNKHEYTDEFEQFWKFYPRKVDKFKAYVEWKKIMKANLKSPLELTVILKRQVEAKLFKEGYVIYCERWLRNRRWEDKIMETNTQPHIPVWDGKKHYGDE